MTFRASLGSNLQVLTHGNGVRFQHGDRITQERRVHGVFRRFLRPRVINSSKEGLTHVRRKGLHELRQGRRAECHRNGGGAKLSGLDLQVFGTVNDSMKGLLENDERLCPLDACGVCSRVKQWGGPSNIDVTVTFDDVVRHLTVISLRVTQVHRSF